MGFLSVGGRGGSAVGWADKPSSRRDRARSAGLVSPACDDCSGPGCIGWRVETRPTAGVAWIDPAACVPRIDRAEGVPRIFRRAGLGRPSTVVDCADPCDPSPTHPQTSPPEPIDPVAVGWAGKPSARPDRTRSAGLVSPAYGAGEPSHSRESFTFSDQRNAANPNSSADRMRNLPSRSHLRASASRSRSRVSNATAPAA
jgi:hypothetical protein